jgi:hypothetical protein
MDTKTVLLWLVIQSHVQEIPSYTAKPQRDEVSVVLKINCSCT